jgi:hypothetical protein
VNTPEVRVSATSPPAEAPELRIRQSRVDLAAALYDDLSRRSRGFPRSATFRLLTDRRLQFATGVAATVLMRCAPALGRRLLAATAALRLLQQRT